MNNSATCPIDFVKVNEAQPRLVAAQVIVLSIVYCFTHYWIIMLFLAIDFFLRAFKLGKYSLVGKIAKHIVQTFYLKGKMVDQAPKRFAAKLGFIFTIMILAFNLTGFIIPSVYLTYLLIAFAIMESVFSFCIGCYIYDFGLKIRVFKQS